MTALTLATAEPKLMERTNLAVSTTLDCVSTSSKH
jgi:hypothetical protein